MTTDDQKPAPRLDLRCQLETAISEMVAKGIYWPEALGEFEKLFIGAVLRKHKGNLCRAASEMGVHRNTLSKKIREYQICCKKRAEKAELEPDGHEF